MTTQSVRINAATAKATFPRFDRANVFLMDPDKPREDPNDMLNRTFGGKMLDPHAVNHNCPFCGKTMNWELFTNHAEGCFRKWRKVVRGQRVHAVPALPVMPVSATIQAMPAAATSKGKEI